MNYKSLIKTLSNKGFLKIAALILLLGILIIPANTTALFDGLPWNSPIEFIVIAVFFPFLLLLNSDYLTRRPVRIFIFALIILKILSISSLPPNGIKILAFSSQASLRQNDHWERTYSTLLNPSVSDILLTQYETKNEFPIEWGNGWGFDESELYLALRLSGFVRLPDKVHLAFIVTGLKEGFLHFLDSENTRTQIPIFEEAWEVSFIDDAANSSEGLIRGELIFKQKEKNWSLVPIVVFQDGSFDSAYKHDALWQSDLILSRSPLRIAAGQWLQAAFDIGVILLFLYWLTIALRPYFPRANWPFGIGIGTFVISRLLAKQYLPEKNIVYRLFENQPWEFLLTEENYLPIWIVVVGVFLIIWARKEMARNGKLPLKAWKILLLAYWPLILGHYAFVLIDDINKVQFLRKGNDYLTFQNFAREIFVYGDPLHTVRSTFRFQPLYRYIVGFLHLFFGQSTASQYFFNVWSFFGSALAISWIAESWMISASFALLGGVSVLFMEIVDRYYKFVLLTLTEHAGSLFIVLTAISWIQFRKKKKRRFVFLASIFGVIGVLIRIEHVLMIAALGLFVMEPLVGSFKEAWAKLAIGISKHWKVLAVFIASLGLSLLALALRNFLIGGNFVLTESQSINFGFFESFSDRVDGVISVLVAKKKNFIFPSTIQSVILWFGTILGIISLALRWGPLRKINLNFGLITIAALSPYFFFKPIAYMPRWSIHLIPFSILLIIVLVASVNDYFSRTK